MFSVLDGGYASSKGRVEGNINLGWLRKLIVNHPDHAIIQELRTRAMTEKESDALKGQIMCIKPHGEFEHYYQFSPLKNKTILKYKLLKLSNFLYFDIDKCNVEQTKEQLLKKHADIIHLMGTSVRGKGIFFYVKIANGELLNKDNFMDVWHHFQTNVFADFKIDTSAKGLARNHVIPSDENLYYNENAIAFISVDSIEKKNVINKMKCATGYDKEKKRENVMTTSCTFLPIDKVLPKIIWKTPAKDIGDEAYVLEDYLYAKIFLPYEIVDGCKHRTFRTMVNALLLNNRELTLEEVLSFIHYVNTHRTGGRKMQQKEMVYVVTTEYDRIQVTGEIRCIKTKHVRTNPKLPRKERQKVGAQAHGIYRKNLSKQYIRSMVDHLSAEGEKPTIKKVAELLKGRLGERTIKQYWRQVVPKREKDIHEQRIVSYCSSEEQPISVQEKSRGRFHNRTDAEK